MTDVGKISLGVEINADDLTAQLGEAVRRAIAPALERIQAGLNDVQREYDATAAASKASATQQVRDNNRVAKSADKAAEAIARARAAAMGSGGGVQRRWGRMGGDFIVNNITNNYRYTTNNRSTTNIRNDGTGGNGGPAGGGGGSGGGGPGGGGGQRDRHAGGFMRGGQGRFGFLTSPVGLGGLALGAQALPAVATGVTNIVGAVQQLGQAGLALPGIFAGAAASIGTAVIGFKGVGDATKELSEALKTGDPKDLEKAKEAMQDMAPAGVALAETFAKLNRGPLLEFRKNMQQRMLADFPAQVQALSDKALPRLEGGMGKVADSWKGTLGELTGALGSDSSLSFMDRIFGNTAEGQKRANGAIRPLIEGMGQLAATGSDFLPRLGDALTKVSERFNSFIQRNAANGNLWRWIDEGLNGLRAFGNAVLNVGKTITGLTKAAGALTGSLSGDGGFLGWLERSTGAMERFTNSAEGQSKLTEFFRGGREDMAQWGDLLKDLWPILRDVIEGFQTWGDVLLPIIGVLANLVGALGEIPGLLEAVVVGFLAWRTLGPIIGGLTTKLRTMGVAAAGAGVGGPAGGGPAGRGRFGGMGAGNVGLFGASAAISGIATQATSGQEDTGSQLMGAASTILGTTATGAAIGSVIPGIGTAIGAGAGAAVGAAISGINYLLADNKTAQDEAAAAADKLAEANARSRSAMELMDGATKSATDSLRASGGAFDAASIGAVGEAINAIPDRLASTLPEDQVKGIAEAMGNLGMTTDQLATTVTGIQPQFDALVGRLQGMGEPGRVLAEQLTGVRNEMLGISENAATAAPLLETLAANGFGNVAQAGVAVSNALASIPPDKPINMDMPQGPAVLDILTKIGVEARVDENKNIVVDSPMAKTILDQLVAMGYEVTHNNDKTINVRMDQQAYLDTMVKLGKLGEMYRPMFDQAFGLPAPPTPPAPTNPIFAGPYPGAPPGADGMVIPGYAPKHDIVNAVLAPGEGVLIPEAVRGIGGPAGVYALNSRFRRGLSKRYYADGGTQPHLGTGALPGPAVGPETELSVLVQIRDLLAGKGGTASNPIAATAANTATSASATSDLAKGGGGAGVGPFGTPLKSPGNRTYNAMKAALEALDFDAETIIGSDPAAVQTATTATGGTGGIGAPLTAVDLSRYSAALTAFARSGNLADVSALGLNANDPVITALVSARNKKKDGLTDDQIAELIDTSFGPTGYTGVLDEQNSPLVKSLQAFREKVAKQTGTVATGAITQAANSFNWDAVAAKESGGNWANQDTGGNGHFGGLQFSPETWAAFGGIDLTGQSNPANATREQQIAIANRTAFTGYNGTAPQGLGAWEVITNGSTAADGITVNSKPGAMPAGTFATTPGMAAGTVLTEDLVKQIAATYGLEVVSEDRPGETGSYHSTGQALDISNGSANTPQMAAFATYMAQNFGGALKELIYNDPNAPGVLVGDGKNVTGTGYYDAGTLSEHENHVHVAAEWGATAIPGSGVPGMSGLPGGGGLPGGAGGSGTPVYVTNWPGGGQGGAGPLGGILGGLMGGVGTAANNVVGDVVGAVPAALGTPEGDRMPDADLGRLIRERNPMALAEALGFNVQDFTRQGGVGAGNTQGPDQAYDASGRLFSDTGALMDRTLTSLNTQLQAMREQLVDVITQVQSRLEEQALEPVVKAGVQSALESLKESVSGAIGAAMGNAAAPPIADAVSSAVASLPIDKSGAGSTGNAAAGVVQGFIPGMAGGGPVSGGTPGRDSVPALLMPGEFVLNTTDVARLGGIGAIDAMRSRGMRRFATGGGVIGNESVGAEFFGVSEVPIIGAIVNLLVRVLLQVIGVEIEVRDTLNEMTDDFRSFRGDAFKAFDAQGRLINDTSGLIDRSMSSEETAAAERIRILKIVIQAIIKYLIEKIIVPITKAVANSVIQAGSSAAGAAISGAGGGPAGGIVSSIISSAGQAGVEIAAEVGTDFALAMSEQLIAVVAEGLQGAFPDLMTGLFSGAGAAAFFNPLGGFLTTLLGGLFGAFSGLLGGGMLGGASTLIPGMSFDEGGMATGIGYLPKATAEPELVLSPGETSLFSRFVSALERGGFGAGNRTEVHAPITVIGGGTETAEQVENRLLKLMP